jgi:hypothetical protein
MLDATWSSGSTRVALREAGGDEREQAEPRNASRTAHAEAPRAREPERREGARGVDADDGDRGSASSDEDRAREGRADGERSTRPSYTRSRTCSLVCARTHPHNAEGIARVVRRGRAGEAPNPPRTLARVTQGRVDAKVGSLAVPS